MKNNITNILTEAIGEDHVYTEDLPADEEYAIEAYNQAKAELRAKIPAIKEAIKAEIIERVEKLDTKCDYEEHCMCAGKDEILEIIKEI
jgi:hypothetical protein